MSGSGAHTPIPDAVFSLCRTFAQAGHRAWLVGGCVRDLQRGLEPKDWDIATDATPDQVSRLFARVVPTGIAHGTVTVLMAHVPYEVTTLRGEGAYSDGRRPDAVAFVSDINEDLARRDFTFNAMAVDPLEDRLIDPFNGKADLEARVLRAVGEPERRFAEDGLRLLRAARFAATLECTVEPHTARAMSNPGSLTTLRKVALERVHDELRKTMLAQRPSIAFRLMETSRVMDVFCPELRELVGCGQNQWHAFDVWDHTLACLDACPADPVLRVGALFHDIAKPRTKEFSEKTKDYTFYNHERIGAEMTGAIVKHLKFSTDDQKRIVALVAHHLVCYSDEWTDAAVRRWIQRVSTERTEDLLLLARADALGKGREVNEELALLERLGSRSKAILAAGAALSTRDLAVDGTVLMKTFGKPPGPWLRAVLDHLLNLVTEDPALNAEGPLLDEARRFLDASSTPA